jgi:hypothetical protein
MRIIRSIIKYIFIIYLFDVLDANILLYTWSNLVYFDLGYARMTVRTVSTNVEVVHVLGSPVVLCAYTVPGLLVFIVKFRPTLIA